MSKFYVSEKQLEAIFESQYGGSWELYDEWLETKLEEGVVERVEFGIYEVSKLRYRPVVDLAEMVSESNMLDFILILVASGKVLLDSGKEHLLKEMCDRIELVKAQTNFYDEAMLIIKEYVEVK